MSYYYKKITLITQINRKQKEMIVKANTFGFSDHRTVCCSQELDYLLNRFRHLAEEYKSQFNYDS